MMWVPVRRAGEEKGVKGKGPREFALEKTWQRLDRDRARPLQNIMGDGGQDGKMDGWMEWESERGYEPRLRPIFPSS